ncbi:MAG: nucleotidyltransferase domain-containing protein [Candidatus Latescibacterota bacterium]
MPRAAWSAACAGIQSADKDRQKAEGEKNVLNRDSQDKRIAGISDFPSKESFHSANHGQREREKRKIRAGIEQRIFPAKDTGESIRQGGGSLSISGISNMKTFAEYIEEIVSRLALLDPYKIILFGSQASGTYTEDSDIDLFVVLDSEIVSQTYEEKMHNYLTASNQIAEINERVPIDLIVYTKAEYDILEENNVSFINEVRKTGKTLYEKASKGLA